MESCRKLKANCIRVLTGEAPSLDRGERLRICNRILEPERVRIRRKAIRAYGGVSSKRRSHPKVSSRR